MWTQELNRLYSH